MTETQNRYIKEALIGHGSFGEVWRAKDTETNNYVAIKAVDLESVDEEIEIVQREIHVMCLLETPYVVQYYRSYIEDTNLFIIMEYMNCGSLRDLIDFVGPLPEAACAYVLKSILGGLAYIHLENKLHRDIKCANTLLNADGEVKLADFGVAASVAGTIRKLTTCRGSPLFMAPEVISSDDYGPQADIWSFGITAIECCTGLPPLANLHPFRAIMTIPRNEPPRLKDEKFSSEFKDFVACALRKDWRLRPAAKDLLEHEFLEKADGECLKELLKMKKTAEDLKQLSLKSSVSFGEENEQFGNGNHDGKQMHVSPTTPKKHHAWDFTLGIDIGLPSQEGSKIGNVEMTEKEGDGKDADNEGAKEKITKFIGISDDEDEEDTKSEKEENANAAPDRDTLAMPAGSATLNRKVDNFLDDNDDDDDDAEEEEVEEQEENSNVAGNDKTFELEGKEDAFAISGVKEPMDAKVDSFLDDEDDEEEDLDDDNEVNGTEEREREDLQKDLEELALDHNKSEERMNEPLETDAKTSKVYEKHARGPPTLNGESSLPTHEQNAEDRGEADITRGMNAGMKNPPGSVITDSKVFTSVFLPVLSGFRANLAEKTSDDNAKLLDGIGKLEVSLNDIEQVRPGTCGVLLESLFKEALLSPAPEVRNTLLQILDQSKPT